MATQSAPPDEYATVTAAALQVVRIVADAIRELGTVPSGVLYAHLAGKFTLDQYEAIIGILKRAGVISVTPAHVIHWIGV
jgi:hypothetical protein